MELVAMHLKQTGSFVCRTLSFTGCSFEVNGSKTHVCILATSLTKHGDGNGRGGGAGDVGDR